MRLNAIILAAAICLSIFSPIDLHVGISPDGQTKYFVSLAVCDASGPFMFSKGELPSMPELICCAAPLEFAGAFIEADYPSVVLPLFFVRIERPPIA